MWILQNFAEHILLQKILGWLLNYLFYLATLKPETTVFYCGFGQAYCKDHTECYEKTGRCDGVYDCHDHSDEDHCEGHKYSTTIRMYDVFFSNDFFGVPSINLNFEENWNSTFLSLKLHCGCSGPEETRYFGYYLRMAKSNQLRQHFRDLHFQIHQWKHQNMLNVSVLKKVCGWKKNKYDWICIIFMFIVQDLAL